MQQSTAQVHSVPVMQQPTAQVHTSTSQTSVNVESPKTTVATTAPGNPTIVNNVAPSIPRKTLTLAELRVHHAKPGHVSIDATIASLRAQNFSISDTLKGSFFCIDCAQSKSHAQPAHSIGTQTLRSTPGNSIIHTDIAGPVTPTTSSGQRYVVGFRHEGTNLFWTTCIPDLTKVANAFQQYAIAMKNDILSAPFIPNNTVLHSDSASVYLAKDMKKTLAQHDVITSASSPYHPTANSMAERCWRTCFDLARTNMAAGAKLSEYVTSDIWPHAIEYSTLIMNLFSSSSEKSAYETITHQSPTTILCNLLPFGCQVIVKIEGSRTKFDPKGAVHIVLGYSLTSQSHKLLNPSTNRIIHSTNVQPDLSYYYNPARPLTSIEETPLPAAAADSDESSAINFNFEETILPIAEIHEVPPDPSTSPATPAAKHPPCDLLEDFSDNDVFDSAVSTPVHMAMNTAPSSLSKALIGPEAAEWRIAIMKECASMLLNQVWIKVEDTGQPRIPSFVIFRRKGDGTMKARIVAGGHKEISGLHFDPDAISSSVLKSISFRLIFLKGIELGLMIYHIDVVTAYLNSLSKHVIYMTLPPQLGEFGVPRLVQLLKGLYGTHDASRLWWDLLHNVLVVKMKFIQSTCDPCLYYHSVKMIILGVYVDDCPLVASFTDYQWVCTNLQLDFNITAKGPMTLGLGIDVHQVVENGILTSVTLSQETFVTDLLVQYGLSDSKPVYTPAVPNTFLIPNMPEYETQRNHHTSTLSIKNFPSVVGSLLWLNLQTRPDITQALNQLTRHVSDPCAGHITAVKHLLRFLNGTRNLGITYSNSGNSIPQIYSDATWASDIYTQRSVQAYVVLLYGAAVSWHCGTQKSISLSSTESEYFALSETVKEAVFIKHTMLQMKFTSIKHWEIEPMTIFEDNQAVIKIVMGDIKHKNQKHILVRLAYVRELFQSKTILPVYVPSADNVADVLTKNLAREPFARFQKSLLGLLT